MFLEGRGIFLWKRSVPSRRVSRVAFLLFLDFPVCTARLQIASKLTTYFSSRRRLPRECCVNAIDRRRLRVRHCKRRRHAIAAAFILTAQSTGTKKKCYGLEPLKASSTRSPKRCHYVARKLVLAVRSESYTQRAAHKHMVTDS